MSDGIFDPEYEARSFWKFGRASLVILALPIRFRRAGTNTIAVVEVASGVQPTRSSRWLHA